MALLDYLFGTRHHLKRLEMNEQHRLRLWNEHITNLDALGKLAKRFSPGEIDYAVASPELPAWLSQIERLISKELITVDDEERTDTDILDELARLKHRRHFAHLTAIARDKDSSLEQRHNAVLDLMRISYTHLSAVLKVVRQLRRTSDPALKKQLLAELFRILYHDMLIVGYRFREENTKPEVYRQVQELCKGILVEERLERATEKSEDRFAKAMMLSMSNERSQHEWRMIGEAIFSELIERAGAPFPSESYLEGVQRFERLVDDQATLLEIIRRLQPGKPEDEMIRLAKAFQQSYHAGGFEALEQYF